jgi:hypothetical protein
MSWRNALGERTPACCMVHAGYLTLKMEADVTQFAPGYTLQKVALSM